MSGAMGRAPVTRRVRAYFAPVNRMTGVPTLFDAAASGGFAVEAPPAPWVDLGWCRGFARRCGTKVVAMRAGAPAIARSQVRTEIEASVAVEFESWGKLPLALAAGSQQMNLLAPQPFGTPRGSGCTPVAAVATLLVNSFCTPPARTMIGLPKLDPIAPAEISRVNLLGRGCLKRNFAVGPSVHRPQSSRSDMPDTSAKKLG